MAMGRKRVTKNAGSKKKPSGNNKYKPVMGGRGKRRK